MRADLTEFSNDDEEGEGFVLDIFESDLMEFGPVGIGADPDAIRSSIDSGRYNHVKNWLMLYAAEKPVQGIGMDTENFGNEEPKEEEDSVKIDERLDRIEQALTDLAAKQSARFGEESEKEEVVADPENLEFTAKLQELNDVCSRQSEALISLYSRLGGL